MIELQDVHKHYASEAGPILALNGINLIIEKGEYVAVLGKSGSGKTTMVNVITALDRLTRGKIFIDGTAIHQLHESQAAAWRGKRIGIIFESFHLIQNLTVLQNVTMPMDFAHYGSLQQRKQRALQLLEQVDIAEHANKYPHAVSGGQQQRIAIARALANDPSILIADEPTGRLDSVTAKAIYDAGLVGKIKLTGLGLPSEMAEWIHNDTCTAMFLWNPIDLGYLAAYVAGLLCHGDITGSEGEKFTGGKMGEYTIVKAADGGTEVLLGPPFRFDKSNIDDWKDVY